ncbi:membrane protease subunit HflC [Anaerotaenia torta]|uniref:protease modulator HflC n=1 Tax=Anaerotaenia torta TaxID=433293 RepID=UPI003D1BC59A
MKKIRNFTGILVLLLVVAGLIISLSATIVTKEDEYTLVKRFGKIERVNSEAGLSFKTPFIETVDVLPRNIQFYDMQESDVITMDKKTMVADSYVLWKITDPIRFAQTLNSSVTAAEGRIDSIVYNTMKSVISSLSQADVISGRDGELNLAFMESIGSSLDPYGIELIAVETKHLDLPGNNKNAVFERMISERAQMAATYTAEGESEAQKIRNTTDKEVAISISNAEAEAAKITAEGEAEYMRTLSQAYADAAKSDFYTFIRSLEAAKTSLSGSNKTLILSKDSPIAKIFYEVE